MVAQEPALADNQFAMYKAAKAPNPVAALEAHAHRRQGRGVAAEPQDEKSQREQRKADRVARKERETRREADQAAAIETVAELWVQRIDDRMQRLSS